MKFLIFLLLTVDCIIKINDPTGQMIPIFKSLLRQSNHFRIVPTKPDKTTKGKFNSSDQV